MNRPVQVMLDPDDRRRARRRAAELGITIHEYMRRLVRQDLAASRAQAASRVPIDTDLAGAERPTHRDRYIGEAVAARLSGADLRR